MQSHFMWPDKQAGHCMMFEVLDDVISILQVNIELPLFTERIFAIN
jgi:hypothetical protein